MSCDAGKGNIEAEIERRLEIARFDLDELARAGFADPNEDAALDRERTRLRNAGRLVGLAEELLERLHGADGAALSAVKQRDKTSSEKTLLFSFFPSREKQPTPH